MSICSPAIRKKRIHAKFIYIQKLYPKNDSYDIGILDDSYNFYTNRFVMHLDAITRHGCKVLNALFKDYLITQDTEIDFLDTIDKTDIVYMYFLIRNQSVFSSIRFISIDRIPRRIAALHITYLGAYKKQSTITKYHMERLWKKLVEMEKCPWITAEINAKIDNMTVVMRRRELVLRMAMYYLVVKRFLMLQSKQSREKAEKLAKTETTSSTI